MSDLRKVLSNFVYRRRTFTKHSIIGKPSFIYGPTEQSVTEKEELLSIVKRDLEVYDRIRVEAGLEGLEIQEP
jgi:hypothetical protein